MKRIIFSLLFLCFYKIILAQGEIGPEGGKLVWLLLLFLPMIVLLILFIKRNKKANSVKKPLIKRRKVNINLEKDRMYFPDNLKLTVKNVGNTDIDLDQPLLILDNFWLKRKFKLKGMQNRTFYPLYLEKGKSHSLQIDLNRFYSHDKGLKKFPKAKITLFDVKGKNLGSKVVFLRKTLVKF